MKPHRGTTILTLGILGLVCCSIFAGIPAWIMGNSDLKAMAAGQMDPGGAGMTKAGKICGMVSVGLLVVGLVIQVIIFMVTGAVVLGTRR